MPFPMKIQPIDFHAPVEEPMRFEPVKPAAKSRFKRLFERQFTSVLRISAVEKPEEPHFNKEGFNNNNNNHHTGAAEFEPSSFCLAKMVQNFIEGSNEKQSSAATCGRHRCNCFNGSCNDGSEDDPDIFGDSSFANSGEGCEILKGLVLCASVWERNLLADTARIVERNKICKRKDEICRTIITDGLLALRYDASICKSRREKSPSYPAGEYEYIDVIIEGERLLIDIDFRSEFEIARPTKTYKTILQILPFIFVGKSDRLQRIVSVVSDAAKQSLKKKGMPVPPWRKAEYVKAKWLSPYTRNAPSSSSSSPPPQPSIQNDQLKPSRGNSNSVADIELGGSEFLKEEKPKGVTEWITVTVPRQHVGFGVKKVTGLASVMEDEP